MWLLAIYATYNVNYFSFILSTSGSFMNLFGYVKTSASLTIEESRILINDLLILIEEAQSSARLDFDDPLLTDEDYQSWTRWNKQQFDKMFDHMSNHLRSSFNRTARNAFAFFWIKLKTNLSSYRIGSLFHMIGDAQTRRKRA